MTINLIELTFIFSPFITFFAVLWGIHKAIDLIKG